MPALKAYTLGNNGFVSADVLTALGLPDHIRQASVTIFATSKADAIRVLEAQQQHAIRYTPKLSDPEFRQVGGPEIEAFLGSWVHEPAVIIEPLTGGGTVTPVARLTADGTPEFWGVLRVIGGQPVFSREQMPEDAR